MKSLQYVNQARQERGPRWHVSWTIRPGEHGGTYAATAADATVRADSQREAGCYQVRVSPPVEYADVLAEAERIGQELGAARLAEADALQRAAALAVTAYDGGKGLPETTLTAAFRVDRMTVRKWLGKR